MRRKHGILAVLVFALLLGLLLAAGPAVAGDPFEGTPPGSQWGGHDVNAKLYIVDAWPIPPSPYGECVVFRIGAEDARVSGILEIWAIEFEATEGGNLLCSGPAVLTPDIGGGCWSGDFTAVIGSGLLAGKPYQHLVRAFALVGSGDYERQVFWASVHGAWGPTWILKGWFEEPPD